MPINFRCNRKLYSPSPNSRFDFAEFSLKVGHNFSKANFYTLKIRQEKVYLVSITWPI